MGRLSGSGADQALTYDSATSTFASVGVESTGAIASQGQRHQHAAATSWARCS